MTEAMFEQDCGVPEGLAALFARSSISLTIADFTRHDCPLIGVNRRFLDICGYSSDEVLGANCRFLQPPGGAGPVCARIRKFLTDPALSNDKFVIPNVHKSGEPFLNLVYLRKLLERGKTKMVLGSQFAVTRGKSAADVYDRALAEDLRRINLLTSENNWAVLGTYEALASSHSIIAQAHLERGDER